jgi:hypothetical protein
MNSFRFFADGDKGDRAQVAHFETPVLRGGHVDRKPRSRRQQRIAVRRSASHDLGRQVAACTATIFRNEAVLETTLKLGRHQPGYGIGQTAGRESDVHRDILRRIALRRSGLRRTDRNDCAEHQRTGRQLNFPHRSFPPNKPRGERNGRHLAWEAI